MGTTTDNYQRKKKLSKSQMKRTERLEIILQKIWNTEERRIKQIVNFELFGTLRYRNICAKLKFKW